MITGIYFSYGKSIFNISFQSFLFVLQNVLIDFWLITIVLETFTNMIYVEKSELQA